MGILLFGDGGYHLDYPDQDDYVDMFDPEAYIGKERLDWIEDKRPIDEFEPRPSAISPVTGKVVPATGMDAVSAAMRWWCSEAAKCDFGIMTGDNIYPSGLTLGQDGFDDDQRILATIVEPYGSLVPGSEDFVTYVTLGNHDWETSRAGGFAQIEYLEQSDAFYMDGPFYSVVPPGGRGLIELFIVDTSMLLATVTVFEDHLADDGSEIVTDIVEPPDYFVEPLTEAERNMAAWLGAELEASTAKWKFVVAHHPIWSSSGSKFEQARALRRLLLPAMCRYADAYLVGHDHTLEIHTDDCSAALGQATERPLVQIVSGAASKQRPINSRFMKVQEDKYPELDTVWAQGLIWGFAHIAIDGDVAHVQLLTVPDDGSSFVAQAYAYRFERRSGTRE